MPFIDVMHAYFRGERIEALCFIVPIGVAFAERRGRPYTDALEVLAAQQRVGEDKHEQ